MSPSVLMADEIPSHSGVPFAGRGNRYINSSFYATQQILHYKRDSWDQRTPPKPDLDNRLCVNHLRGKFIRFHLLTAPLLYELPFHVVSGEELVTQTAAEVTATCRPSTSPFIRHTRALPLTPRNSQPRDSSTTAPPPTARVVVRLAPPTLIQNTE